MYITKNDLFIKLSNIIRDLDEIEAGALLVNKQNKIVSVNVTASRCMKQNMDMCIGISLRDIGNKYKLYKMEIPLNEDNDKYSIYLIKNSSKNNRTLLNMSADNLRIILESVYDAIIIHDLEGNIIDVNTKMLEMYGIEYRDAISKVTIKELSAIHINNDFTSLFNTWNKVLHGENQLFEWKAKSYSSDKTFDVEVYLTKISLCDYDAILANIRDITERKRSEETIRYLSYYDKLTGLYNRAFFEGEIARLNNNQYLPLSIIIADVNGLKLTNDAFGHLAGDELLKLVATVLNESSRKGDIVARWGGDEFAIILANTDEKEVQTICSRIVIECNKIKANPIPLSISLGYATKNNYQEDILDTIKEAETNMYSNKLKEGRKNRQVIINSLIEKLCNFDSDIEFMTEQTLRLARLCGIDEDKFKKLELLVKIHDIGNVSIPKDILNKLDPLSDEEWESIKKHCEVGYRIASTYPEYAHVAEDILSHHERWNGTGYPRGLQGDEIPLLARILSIVEAYDAIIKGRPYREALDKNKALLEIKRNAGIQFDPHIADLFIKIISE